MMMMIRTSTVEEIRKLLEQFDDDAVIVGSMNWIPQGCDGVITSITKGYFTGNKTGIFFTDREYAEYVAQGKPVQKAVFLDFGEE